MMSFCHLRLNNDNEHFIYYPLSYLMINYFTKDSFLSHLFFATSFSIHFFIIQTHNTHTQTFWPKEFSRENSSTEEEGGGNFSVSVF